jgi:hypothetical protein
MILWPEGAFCRHFRERVLSERRLLTRWPMWIVTLMPSFVALGLFFGTLAIRPARR